MKPLLEKASFEFSQEGNCLSEGAEFIEITCEASLGIERDEGCFFVIKTEGWSINSTDELDELFERIKKVIVKEK